MQPSLIAAILVSVLLSAGSQIILKFGMTAPTVQAALAQPGDAPAIALAIASSPLVLVGLASFGMSAVVWLFVLSRVPLSSAYPFVALGIVITVAAGRLLFGDPFSAVKILGVGLVVSGVLVLAASG
jgi:multidrug transporter EmrE-like cation transporter